MANQPMTCDPKWIELFLQQKLSDEEQAAFESHLDECIDCRRQLESAAADDDIWSGVRDLLRDQELSPDKPSEDFALDSTMGGGPSGHNTILTLLAPSDDDRMLGRLGSYEILGIVGSGGMGVVLKALDPALNRYVAIKVLAPHLSNSGAARKRFLREAQAAAAVVHDSVIEIYGVADTAELPYLVMPYVRGPSLQRRLDDEGALDLAEVLRIGVQAASGLAAAHAQGLVHRDVKPANILLADGIERVKLTDFGLARAADDASLTMTGVIAGTPQYMSPEQACGESIDQRSDLFSLGSVLYAMCTGRAPFRAETSYGVLRRITDEEPRPIREINPDVPEWLCRIIARLMSKRPGDRFASAHEVAALLEACLAHVQQPTAVALPESLRDVAPSARTPWSRWSIRKILVGTAAAVAFFAAGIVLMLYLNKGTLVIKSDAENVKLQITQGDKVVENLTVTTAGKEVRIAAGNYKVKLLADADADTNRLVVKDGTFTLARGSEHLVTIELKPKPAKTKPNTEIAISSSVHGTTSPESRLWNEFGVTPGPVSPLTARVLEWSGLHLCPVTKNDFRDKNVFTKFKGGLRVTFVRSHGPAEKVKIREGDIVIGIHLWVTPDLKDLDFAVQEAVKDIRAKKTDSLEFFILRNGKPHNIKIPFPVEQLDLKALATVQSTKEPTNVPITLTVPPVTISNSKSKLTAETIAISGPFILATGQEEETSATPRTSEQQLTAMTGWVIAWDAQNPMQHGDNSRRAMLRMFADGRVVVIPVAGDPLLRTKIDPKTVQKLVKEWKAEATERSFDPFLAVKSKGAMLAENYHQFETSMYQAVLQFHIGDPLPTGLWDQYGERVTICDGGKIYDLLSIEPERLEYPDPGGTRDIAPLTKEMRKELLKLIEQAISENKAKEKHKKKQEKPNSPDRKAKNSLR